MKRVLTVVIAVALLGGGVWYAVGGGAKAEGQFGSPVGASVTPIREITRRPEAYLGKTVTVEGTLSKECPTSGCWWYTKDATGELRASSEGSTFALPLHQEGKTLRTTGKVIRGEGGALELAAVGARF